MNGTLLQMNRINKSFPGVKALDNVDLRLDQGQVLALIGENGAGKSTLMKVLCGVYMADAGEILLEGNPVQIHTPHEATDLGIIMIHQELNLIREMTISENIFLGSEVRNGSRVLLNRNQMNQSTAEVLRKVGLDRDPKTKIRDLSVGEQQMVEIAKALSKDAKIIVFDEPTAALTNSEIEKLFVLIRELKQAGVGMIYISHRMDEIFRISDAITVLRDGIHVYTAPAADTNIDQVIQHMVGRELSAYYPKRRSKAQSKVLLELENVTVEGELDNISFKLFSGEILGIAGLMGAGRSELTKTIFGAKKLKSGRVLLNGQEVKIRTPTEAISHGIHLVTEDRKLEGLLLSQTVQDNIVLPNLKGFRKGGLIDSTQCKKTALSIIQDLSIKTPNERQKAKNLSGGNQQKIVIGKWLVNKPRILILDEPTRGVDVGAKSEIYNIIMDLAAQGISIIVVSSELPELLGITERIVVMHEGRITGEYITEQTNQEELMFSATGSVIA